MAAKAARSGGGPRGGLQWREKGDGGGSSRPRWDLRWPTTQWRGSAVEGAHGGGGRSVRRRGEGGEEERKLEGRRMV